MTTHSPIIVAKTLPLGPLRRKLAVDLTGMRFGRLLVRECLGRSPKGTAWKCVCDCGNEVVRVTGRLTAGNISSCGCFRREKPRLMARPVIERFMSHVLKTESCWLWQSSLSNKGYGLFTLRAGRGGIVLAHRFSYSNFVGEITGGLFVCHACDVRNCVNPQHLWLGTQSDNIRDAVRKGRHKCNFNKS